MLSLFFGLCYRQYTWRANVLKALHKTSDFLKLFISVTVWHTPGLKLQMNDTNCAGLSAQHGRQQM